MWFLSSQGRQSETSTLCMYMSLYLLAGSTINIHGMSCYEHLECLVYPMTCLIKH